MTDQASRDFHRLDPASPNREGERFFEASYGIEIRIIRLIVPDNRPLNEDPGTMEELTETEKRRVAFKWEQL